MQIALTAKVWTSADLKHSVLTGVNTIAKILLAFPPFVAFAANHPYLSLPLLAGYLRRRGMPADQRDLNAEFIRYALDDARLRRVATGYDDRLRTLEGGGNAKEYEELLKKRLEVECLLGHLHWMKTDHEFSHRIAKILSNADPRLGAGTAFDDLGELERLVGDENPYHDFFEDELWEGIEREGYRIVGLSVAMSPQLVPALCFARMINAKDPAIHVILGGAAINLADDETLARIGGLPYVHGIARFGGGESLFQVVEAVSANDRGRSISNYIDCTGSRPRFPAAYEPASVDESADCHFDRQMLSQYPDPPVLPVLYSMGCYWGKCTFCTHPKLFRDALQLRAVPALVDQLADLVQTHGCRRFHLIGECLPPKYAAKVANEIIERGLDVKFGSFLRIDPAFTSDALQRLADAGFEWAAIGVESTNDRLLALMRKGHTADMIAPQLRWCREAGIAVTVDMIIDFPTTTKEEALRVLEDARGMAEQGHGLSFESFVLQKGTEVWSRPETFGIEVAASRTTSSAHPVHDGFVRCCTVPFRDRNGMAEADRAEVTRLYRDLERDVKLRPYRAMFWQRDPSRGTWRWDLLAQFATSFLALAARRLCYNFLEDEIFGIDERTHQYLEAIHRMPDEMAGDLAAYLEAQGFGPSENVEHELCMIFEKCMDPRPVRGQPTP